MNAFVSKIIFAISLFGIVGASTKVLAQNRTVYKSEIDELLTIQSVSVLPFSDNVQGIYARPLENQCYEALAKLHSLPVAPLNSPRPIFTPSEL